MGALDDAKRQLYSGDPSEFVKSRDRLAAEARERGDGELASSIKKLRRPDMAAHAVNLLAWHEGKRVDALADVGERLRAAQRNLRGAEIRQLDGERSRLVAELVDRAVALVGGSGRPFGGQARRQVEQTLHAMVSDPESARRVCSGALTKPLEYSGFGLDELSTAALRNSGRHKGAKSAGARGEGRSQARRRKREDDAEAGTRAKMSRTKAPRDELSRKKSTKGGGKVAAAQAAEVPGKRAGRAETRQEQRERVAQEERAAELSRAEADLRHAESEQRHAERRRARLGEQLDEVERKLREAEREMTEARRRADDARKRHQAATNRQSGSKRRRS